MKNIQTHFLKILLLFSITFFPFYNYADTFSAKLHKADSLFQLKQYTQSFEIYNALLSVDQYSPAMLLKMAYIQEGLGKASMSLYYLNLYYLATGDEQSLEKMQELATKNKLEGYQNPDQDKFYYHINQNSFLISFALAGMAIFAIAFLYSEKRKNKRGIGATILLLIFVLLLAVNTNFPLQDSSVIVTSSNTYLMQGPSAGANVLGIVNEGHKLRVLDKKDVWIEVEWMDKTVYIKENRVLPVAL
jgi:hypothetical protein